MQNSRQISTRSKPKLELKEIGSRIRDLRGDVRQEDFAIQLGISQGHLSKVERGQLAPTLEIVLKLAVRFDKTLDWLVRGESS
jgi:transcriptional regulator with XRE-family HTH domain